MNAKEVCSKGHPFDAENTYTRSNGARDCRECIRARARDYQARKRGAGGFCTECHQSLIPRKTWMKLDAESRQNARNYGMAPAGARGLCKRCHKRLGEKAKERPSAYLNTEQTADRLEDLQWMADTGESFAGAAARLGLTERSLERFLAMHECEGIGRQLRARNPRDHNRWNRNQHTDGEVA